MLFYIYKYQKQCETLMKESTAAIQVTVMDFCHRFSCSNSKQGRAVDTPWLHNEREAPRHHISSKYKQKNIDINHKLLLGLTQHEVHKSRQ